MHTDVVPDSMAEPSSPTDEPTDSLSQSMSSLARFAASSGTVQPQEVFVPGSSRSDGVLQPKSLLIDSVRAGDGMGPVVDLSADCGKLLVVTLSINSVEERTGLTVAIWGSKDQIDWGSKPMVTFRERQYCGVYSVLLNMVTSPALRWLRVQWTTNRWGKGERNPSFGFQVFFEESGARISGVAVA